MTPLHLRNSVNPSPLWRSFLLIAFLLVWFARSEHAETNWNSYATMLGNNADRQASLFREFNRYNAFVSQTRASLPAPSWAPSNRQPAYEPPPTMRQFPITATDFKPTTARILPVEWVRVMPGLPPNQRAILVATNNQFLDGFELVRRKNNVATSFAWLACISLHVVDGQQYLGSDTDGRLIGLFNDSLANNLQFVTMDPRNRQVLYEQNIITAGWIYWNATQKINQRDAQLARENARVVLKQLLGIETR